MYELSIKLAEEHQEDICRAAVKLFISHGVTQYQDRPTDEVVKRILPALQMHIRYLKSGDLEQWKTECIELATLRINQGLAYSSVIQASEYVISALEEFFQTELPTRGKIDNISPEKVIAGLQRRLQGLKAITTATIMSVGIKNNTKL